MSSIRCGLQYQVTGASYNEYEFQQQVATAVTAVKMVLENNRHPTLPSNVSHSYEDKYELANTIFNTSLVGLRTTLGMIGVDEAAQQKMKQWVAKEHSVTFRFNSERRCSFIEEQKRQIESDTIMHVSTTERSGWMAGKKTSMDTTKVITEVTEYLWSFRHAYSITMFPGNKPEEGVQLQGRSGQVELVTRAEESPKPEVSVLSPIDVNVTDLVKLLPTSSSTSTGEDKPFNTFSINRSHPNCQTPVSNPDVFELVQTYLMMTSWCNLVREQMMQTFHIQLQPSICNGDTALDISALITQHNSQFFVPVLSIFEDRMSQEASKVLPVDDVAKIMKEHKRCLDDKLASLGTTFEGKKELISTLEVHLCYLLGHLRQIMTSAINAVLHVEEMLRKQVIAAIGKVVGVQDIGEYMRFHDRKLFAREYAPRAFHYDIRRAPGYAPEGSLSIEADGANDGMRPINTYARLRDGSESHPMQFSLNAATEVTFTGPHVLHGYVQHSFSGEGAKQVQLIARARQFSSYILLVGKIAAANLFEPLHGILVQNKDEVLIPLLMTPLPTPKEFKDAIESLSPEQQRFAKAYRAMQLESTLFAVCVIQIKPQMERLLRLPGGALAKEIRLTQDLMKLFIEYQIPSDLLTYEGPEDSDIDSKVEAVKGHVTAVNAMIANAKEQEVEEQTVSARSAMLENISSSSSNLVYCSAPAPPMADCFASQSYACTAPPPPPPTGACFGGAPPQAMALSLACAPGGRARCSAVRSIPVSAPAPRKMMMAPQQQQKQQVLAATKHEVTGEGREGGAGESSTTPASASGGMGAVDASLASGSAVMVDYTKVPAALDKQFEALDKDAALRPTTVTVGEVWTKKASKRLVSADKPTTTSLGEGAQKTETNRCMDLLDALSRSGDLELHDCVLHVVVAATHCFDQTVMDTLVKSNVNPIERIERSALIVSSIIHQCPVPQLLADDAQKQRLLLYSPVLFGDDEQAVDADHRLTEN